MKNKFMININKILYMSDPISEPNYLTGPNTDERFRRLVFAVSFFHAVVQERRLFGPLGWNIPYSFSDTDLRISVLQLKEFARHDVPWEALLYLTAECNYGGKVTDQRDRRTLATLLERFYCPEVLKEENYSFDQSGGYLAPPDGDHEMFLSYIDELPRDAPPRVFGMNSNANITKDQAETTKLFSALLITQQSSLSAGGHEGDSDVDITGRTCEDILSRLPKLFDVDAALAKFPTLREQSLNTVLLQEMCRYNTLISTITSSLQSVLRALAGTVTASLTVLQGERLKS
ncbi:Dynein heavy chain 7, axonemal [Armadillidium vulgare]|nr:Dynein heavy chain 7, axonemal [Armadillidium vulgare]